MERSGKYEQLKFEERVTIASLRLQRVGVRSIARTIGRAASTVSRELRRNAQAQAGYSSVTAQAAHAARRRAARPKRKLDVPERRECEAIDASANGRDCEVRRR